MPMHQPALYPANTRAALACTALLGLSFLAACSRSDAPEHALMFPNQGLPEAVLGYASWEDDGERKPIRRVSCHMEDSFYVMVAEGRDFVLRVGFWGDGAREIDDIDFEQADSVELRAVDDELYFYRYTTLRILSEMGPVQGSAAEARGRTALRPTSTEAVVKHRAGVELDFEFTCPEAAPAPVARS